MPNRWVELETKEDVIALWDMAFVARDEYRCYTGRYPIGDLDSTYPHWFDNDRKNGWKYVVLVEE